MNMVERVARAILKSMDDDLDPDELTRTPLGRPLWMECEYQARAAIEAMRMPSEDMELAGDNYADSGATVWIAMIDAALQEPTR